MKNCSVCNSTDLSKYPYDNHLYRTKKSYIKYPIKYLLARAISPVLSKFHSKYCDWADVKLIFSPFSWITRCKNCGYGVYDKSITPRLLEKYYNTVYRARGLLPDQWQKKDYLEDSRAIGQYCCVENWIDKFPKLNMLEIGAGKAYFSRLVKEKHQGEVKLNVVEPGNCWGLYYKELGIPLVAKFFPFESNLKFHYIHTSHWLEHVSDLCRALDKIKSLLVKDGLLFIEVPNCSDDYYSLDVGDIPHIHFFTRESLSILLEKYGFQTLVIGEHGESYREEKERWKDPENFDKGIIQGAHISILKNVPRKGGASLRALFKLSG
jgi:hypothetical protein